MGCVSSKQAKESDNNGSVKSEAKAAAVPAASPATNGVAVADDKPASAAPALRAIPMGEPIKLDDLDENFILFEPIEDHYELGEEIGKYVFLYFFTALFAVCFTLFFSNRYCILLFFRLTYLKY